MVTEKDFVFLQFPGLSRGNPFCPWRSRVCQGHPQSGLCRPCSEVALTLPPQRRTLSLSSGLGRGDGGKDKDTRVLPPVVPPGLLPDLPLSQDGRWAAAVPLGTSGPFPGTCPAPAPGRVWFLFPAAALEVM